MALCQLYDFTGHRALSALKSRPYIGQSAAALFLAVSIVAFTMFAPLAYGNMWTQDECKRVKLFDTWDWDCNAFYPTYQDYALSPIVSNADAVPSSDAPPAPAGGEQGLKDDPKAGVTPIQEGAVPVEAGVSPGSVISREEKVEYRDEEGNLLDPERVAELEGKVSFKTRYETRTRVVDEAGNEIAEGPAGEDYDEGEARQEEMVEDEVRPQGWAPPHPDVEGANSQTGDLKEEQASKMPPAVEASLEGEDKENKRKEARPGSEVKDATKAEL